MQVEHIMMWVALGLVSGCTLDLPRDTEFPLGERLDSGFENRPVDVDIGVGLGGGGGQPPEDGAGGQSDDDGVGGQPDEGGAGGAPFVDGAGGHPDEGAGGAFDQGGQAGDGGTEAMGGSPWVPTSPYATFPEAPLVAHWAFDEGDGDRAYDQSGNEHHGELVRAGWSPEGMRSGALALDGDGHVAAGTFDVSGHGLTLAAWVYLVGSGGQDAHRIISKAVGHLDQEHHWMLSLIYRDGEDEPYPRFRLRTQGGGSEYTEVLIGEGPTVPCNEWVHVAATYDGATMSLYLNGALVGQMEKTGAIAEDDTIAVLIGSNPDQIGPWVGALDDVAVLAGALRPEEVCRLAEADPSMCDALVE